MAHEGLWEQLLELDVQKTARRAKCRYLTDPGHYAITLLNTAYTVDPSDKRILSGQPDSKAPEAGFLEQLCILVYLIKAQDLPLADKLVRAEALPGGQFFFRGLHRLPTGKLEEAFGERPELLYQAAKKLGAKRCEFGDASIELYVLPRIPLTVVLWGADEEFGARASLLFDQTAAAQLPLDALLTAVNLTVDALVSACAASN